MEKNDNLFVKATDIKMLATIKTNDDGLFHGKLECKYFNEPYFFSNLMGMIEMMENTFDIKGFPEKELLPRSFGKDKPRFAKNELDLNTYIKENIEKKEKNYVLQRALARSKDFSNEGEADITQEPLPERTCSFEIQINYRNNAEWQGNLKWIDKDVTKPFSSIVEMMKLINSALEE